MVMRTIAGIRTGEDSEDLEAWLRQLDGSPTISRTLLCRCESPVHGDTPATWFYVEADAVAAVARRRCLSCGDSCDVLDSGEHWNAPRMWSCGCGQSIAEVAAGLHLDDDGLVTWVALAARCVNCGAFGGLTDFNVDAEEIDDLVSRL